MFKVIGYFCDELGVHINYYLESFGYLFDIKPNPRNFKKRLSTTRRRPGLVGLFEDIMEIIPTDEIIRIFTDAYQTNESVRRAVAKIKGDEFRRVAEAIEASEEFADLTQRMRTLGLDVDCLVCGLKRTLGWLDVECQCGNLQ